MTEVPITVLQGEAELAKDNHLVAVFTISGIKSAPRGREKIDVTFKVDKNGILSITA